MASSRLEKIGTIFTRVNGLLKTGAMKWEDRPIWYDVYKAFPPTDEPRYDRPAPDIPVRNIFYEEDNIRALYHKNNKNLGTVNLFNNENQTKTMKFIDIYKKLEASDAAISKEQLYTNAIEMLNHELDQQSELKAQLNTETSNLASTFREAQEQKQVPKIDVKKIFQDD